MKIIFIVFTLVMTAMPASAQWLDRPWPGIPRTASGEPDTGAPAPRGVDGHPDFTGVWSGPPPVANLDPAFNYNRGFPNLPVSASRIFTRIAPCFAVYPMDQKQKVPAAGNDLFKRRRPLLS
jgi:hypothetical protein